jgi:hypothetical protein
VASGFVKQLREHARELDRLQGTQAKEFLKHLEELKDYLRARLYSVGSVDMTLDVFHLRQVLAETEVGIATLEQKAGKQFSRAQLRASQLSMEHMAQDLDRLGLAFDGERLGVNIEAAKVLADPGQQLLAEQFKGSLREYGLKTLNGVRRSLFIGNRTGQSLGETVRTVTAPGGPLGGVATGGAERLVRTEVSNAYGVAQQKGIEEVAEQTDGELKKVWLHIGSYPCPVCMPAHGTERPLDGTWTFKQGKRSWEVAHPPAHPHCVCRISAMKPKWRKAMQKLGYLDQKGEEASPAQL